MKTSRPAGLKGVSAHISEDGLRVTLQKEGKLLEELRILPATEKHRSFIIATWVKSGLGNPRLRAGVSKDVWQEEEAKLAEKSWSLSYVLAEPGDDFAIHGWICSRADGTLLHVYVPPELRQIGIAKALIGLLCGPSVVSGRVWPYENTPRGLKWTYNPYRLAE